MWGLEIGEGWKREERGGCREERRGKKRGRERGGRKREGRRKERGRERGGRKRGRGGGEGEGGRENTLWHTHIHWIIYNRVWCTGYHGNHISLAMLHLLTTLANGFPVCSFWASKGSWKGRKKALTGVTCLLYMWECVYVASDILHEHCSYIIVRRGLHSSSTLCCCWLCVGEREGGKWLARSVHAKAAVPHTDRQADTHTHTQLLSHIMYEAELQAAYTWQLEEEDLG